MKRFFTICIALLLAGSAFAQEVKQEEKKGPEFKYGIKAWAFGVKGQQNDYKYDYSHIRVRPLLTLGIENIKVVTQLEIDQDFGREESSKSYTSTETTAGGDSHTHKITIKDDSNGADPGTDNKVVEVKNVYIEATDVIIPNLSLMGGLNGYSFPLVVNNDFALFQAGYNFGIGKVNLSYIKLDEYSIADKTEDEPSEHQKNDVTAYALDLPLKISSFTIRPGVIHIKGGEQSSSLAKAALTNYALNISGSMGIVSFNATGAMMKGVISDNGIVSGAQTKVKNNSRGFDAGVDIKPADGIKIGFFGTYGTGNDGNDSKKDNSYFYNLNNVFGKTSNKSGAPDGRLFLLENATVTSAAYNDFDYMDSQYGYMSYGLNAEAKISKLTLFAQFGMAKTVKSQTVTINGIDSKNKNIGSEIDIKASYEIAPKSSLFTEFGYLMAGDDMNLGKYTKAENAYQFAWGLSTQI